ncbi:MAG: alpha-ketoglutarate-dependent dioxygenase AlkB [Steroidobacteraceae bacterium]|jgi:alkylated DNA repair protein (DNA oxidative demethylase)|nr:alpha-ketoglutarate-dependent dioxygenase AlkB [Steroidobacteraceae bacterium]
MHEPVRDARRLPHEQVAPEVLLLRGRAAPTAALVAQIEAVARAAPFRQLRTPGGGTMSVAMTNCGTWGWHSDARGYRYVECDPLSGSAWPAMPAPFRELAAAAAAEAGFPGFEPDACLVNRYEVGAQMGAHRDFDELDMRHPIVSVSIGLPALFLWHGATRGGSPRRVALHDGDVLVWGGAARAGYHAVRRIAPPDLLAGAAPGGTRPLRYNLTFRRAR